MFLEGRGLNFLMLSIRMLQARLEELSHWVSVSVPPVICSKQLSSVKLLDLTGERGSLMGAIQGLLLAQYGVLRVNGHSPSGSIQ